MSSSHLLYLKEKNIAWFNPSYGIICFWNEYRKLKETLNKEHDYIWKHRDLKRAKEIYAISIIAKVTEKQENIGPWWIIKPKNDPPDGVMGTIVDENGYQKMLVREIEVVEHVSGDVLDTIKNKLSKKQYEPNTVLVCYLSNGGIHDFESLSTTLKKEVTTLDHIFLVFPGMKVSDIPKNLGDKDFLQAMYKLSVVQLKPVYNFSTLEPLIDCKDWTEGKEANFLIFDSSQKGGLNPITLEDSPKLF